MQRSAVTEYIASDLTKTFVAEETAARVFVNKIIRYIKKNVRKQQCFEFRVPIYIIGYRPYDVPRCTSIIVKVLKNLGLYTQQISHDLIYVEIEIDLDKLLKKYEYSLASSISSDLAYDYEKIGLITKEQKERIYEQNMLAKRLSLASPYKGYSSVQPSTTKDKKPAKSLEDSFGGMTLDELFEDTESDRGSVTSRKSAKSMKSLEDFFDV